MKIKRSNKAEVKKAGKVQPQNQTLLEQIEEELSEEGIDLFTNDNVENEYLQLPKDITEVPSKELGQYLNAFTQQKMWTRTLIGRVAVTLRQYKVQLDIIKAEVFISLPAKMSVKEKELQFSVNEEAQVILDEQVIYEEKYRMLQDYIANLEDGIFNISREVTRRSGDFNNEQRVDNIGRKRR